MTATITQIQQAAKGGFARVDAAGQWKTGGKGLGGRMIAWVTGIVSRGRVAKENRAAIDHFIQALRSDTRYNSTFSIVTTNKLLKPLSVAGKPLRERTVTQVLSEIEGHRVCLDEINHDIAKRFSTTDPNGMQHRDINREHGLDEKSPFQNDPQSFTAELRKAARKRGLPQDLPQSIKTYAAVKKAAENIRQEILAGGDTGKRQIPAKEARKIAKKHIGELTDQLATLRDILSASDMGDEEKRSLRQRLAGEPDLSKEIIFSFIHGGRTNQLAYESGELPKMLSRAARDEGLSELAGDLTLKAGVDSGMVVQVARRLMADFPDAIATKEEILSRLNAEVSGYVAARKKLMGHVDTHHNLKGEARAEMRKIIAQDPSIKDTEHIDIIIAAATSYEPFFQSIIVCETEDMAAAYVRYQKNFDQAAKPLINKDMTAAEIVPRRIQALSLWVAQQKDKAQIDPDQADKVRLEMTHAHANLTSGPGDRWVDSTVWVAEQHRRVDSKVDAIARGVQNLRHAMAAEIGDYLGIKPADSPDAATREGIVGNINGEADVPDNVYFMFRDLDVMVPLPELMGRSKAEAYDNRFSERFLNAINDALATPGNWQNGIDRDMYVDLDRANFFTGEPGTPEDLLTSARKGEGKEAALNVFSRLFDDEHDEAGKQAVSKVTNQGIFAEVEKAFMHGCGPFARAVVRKQEGSDSYINYRTWREPGGSGYRVQAAFAGPVEIIRNPEDDSVLFTDLATSKFAFEATIRISRQSIDEGNPKAELVTTPTYEYKINPAQEE